MYVEEIRQYCKLQAESQSLIWVAMTQRNLSARAYHRTQCVKLARTIADLVGTEEIQSVHLAEAVHVSRSAKCDEHHVIGWINYTY